RIRRDRNWAGNRPANHPSSWRHGLGGRRSREGRNFLFHFDVVDSFIINESVGVQPGTPMSKPLRILIVEDSEADTQLLLDELRRGAYEPAFERVDTPAAMSAALDQQNWDLIVADFSMPQFNALAALE